MTSYQGSKKFDQVNLKGYYRVLCYDLNKRSVLVTHAVYTLLLSRSKEKYLPLAGVPAELGMEFNINLTIMPVWKARSVKYVRELPDIEIKGLAPGIVSVEETRSPFLFYGNMWIQLPNVEMNQNQEAVFRDFVMEKDEDSQTNFMPAIQAMEQRHEAIKTGRPVISMKVKNHMPPEQKLMDADGFPFGDWRVKSNTGDVTATAKVMQAETGWKFPMCYRMVVDFMKKNGIKQLSGGN